MNFGLFSTTHKAAPLVLTTLNRRDLLRQAMGGATVYEQRVLVRAALDCLCTSEQTAMVRELDREQWARIKP